MRKILKYIFHNIVCSILLACGIDSLLRNLTANKRLIIMYHGVRKGGHRINGRHITAEQFEKHLKYFTRNFNIVPLRQLCGMKATGNIPAKHTIALTFDDGFLNNLTVALPLLEKYKVPATFFICSAGITDQTYGHPTDRVDLIRVSKQPESIQIGEDNFYRQSHHVLSRANRKHAYQYINELSYNKWLQANDDLEKQLDDVTVDKNGELYKLLNDRSAKDLAKSHFATIGSHSHHHINLTVLNAAETQHQLSESRKILESFGKPVDILAFPYGFYNDKTITAAGESGYQYLIAGGHVDPPFTHDVFPRIGVLDGAGFSYTMLVISKGFRRFGF